jgi:hypothetical protein
MTSYIRRPLASFLLFVTSSASVGAQERFDGGPRPLPIAATRLALDSATGRFPTSRGDLQTAATRCSVTPIVVASLTGGLVGAFLLAMVRSPNALQPQKKDDSAHGAALGLVVGAVFGGTMAWLLRENCDASLSTSFSASP